MKMHARKVVVVITEALLEKPLAVELKKLGAHGYTVTPAYGEGSRGKRSTDLEGAENVRIEIVCDETIASKITERLSESYMPDYAMILYVMDAEVVRPLKF